MNGNKSLGQLFRCAVYFLPLKGCRGIVFTNGVRMGGQGGGGGGGNLVRAISRKV